MTGATTIARHLAQLRVYLDRLRELQQNARETLKTDWYLQGVVERNLQLAVEVVISVSEQLVASLSLPVPDSGREALSALADAQIITHDLADDLRKAVGFRNIIVHQYMTIDYDKVYDVLQNGLADLEAFLTAVSVFLRSQNQP